MPNVRKKYSKAALPMDISFGIEVFVEALRVLGIVFIALKA